ncbi:sodium-coupled monocarboxylate transporter 1-like [Mizuhopecten yessoensis]|uniref:sodium-coupled monocarboxylate transporter 1-like n=1 Tax=Mizuhopecten yessoensis TaxID=6573 RepID=UPI000B459725|nr:sodium-coupled monocarboxylate transporter 1-like [Mizuhopecten yessoensis]
MAVIPVAVSLMVTLISGITMFGVPAEVYMYGMQMFIGTTAIFFSNLLNMHLLLPAQKKLRITSVNQGTIETGGAASTWKIVSDKGRINMLNFDPDPTARQSFWSLTVGCLIYGFGTQFRQSIFQRIKATPNVSTAKRMFFLASVLALMVNGLAFIAGAVIFAYYHAQGCDPLVSKQVTNPNQLMAKMVTDIFQDTPCLPGLFLASVFSASLSTMSSLLSASAAMFWEDIVKPHTKPMSERRALVIVQFAVLCFGGLGILVAIAVSGIKGPMSWILHVTESTFVGALTGIFVLGWFIPKANSLGGLIGGLVSVLFVGWISLGKLLSSGQCFLDSQYN